MCILPEMFCCWCLTESYGQLLRYPVEEVETGLRLCAEHKRTYLKSLEWPECVGVQSEAKVVCNA